MNLRQDVLEKLIFVLIKICIRFYVNINDKLTVDIDNLIASKKYKPQYQ